MLTVETIGRIRREHFIKGKTIREIARDLKVSRNTVRKVLRSGETSFEYERSVQPRPKLGRWAADLEDLLAGNATKPAPIATASGLEKSLRVAEDVPRDPGEPDRAGEPKTVDG